MTRIRRISIELIRRELRVAVRRPVAAAAEERTDIGQLDGSKVQVSPSPPPECPACASPWFVLSAGSGEEPAIIQRALEKHGIHTCLSPAGELLVCGRSFEVHMGAFDVASVQSPAVFGSGTDKK